MTCRIFLIFLLQSAVECNVVDFIGQRFGAEDPGDYDLESDGEEGGEAR
jgi:hypothetical protein